MLENNGSLENSKINLENQSYNSQQSKESSNNVKFSIDDEANPLHAEIQKLDSKEEEKQESPKYRPKSRASNMSGVSQRSIRHKQILDKNLGEVKPKFSGERDELKYEPFEGI